MKNVSPSIELPNIADGEDKTSMLGNRIRKNYRHVRKWAKRAATNCFRIYDWEIGAYPLAIDFYDGRFCVHYFSKDRNTLEVPEDLVNEVNQVLTTLFNADSSAVYFRSRIKREKRQQYEKLNESKEFFTVLEYGVKFRVNLLDYLDTGLFLDHRETRQYVASLSKGKKVLNLFAYTCSFSVHAAVSGALYTKSVDMSNTYTAWGKENLILNGQSLTQNEIVREDCLKFLEQETKKYEIIIVDPPTISRSKKMDQMFDIQQDYIELLTKALRLLTKDGILIFSTNSRKFVLDENCFKGYKIWNVSEKTIPIDFHNSKIHSCWKFFRE